jgi:UDP-N-acetylglucosamine acyltransferase
MACLVAECSRVDPGARVADDAIIGPGCVIGPDVEIGRGTELVGRVCLLGAVRIGEFNKIGPFVAIGGEPQDLSYWGTATRVEIGDHNLIHERVTIHRGSEKEDGITRIGSYNCFHSSSHIAHDCKLADRITIGSLAMIGGHVHIQSDAYISEKVGVHQFSTIGRHSYVVGQSKIVQDVPCYMRVAGNPSAVRGINGRVLLKRGLTGESRAALRAAHRLIFLARMTLGQASEILEVHHRLTPEVIDLLKFVEAQHQGRLGRGRERRRGA